VPVGTGAVTLRDLGVTGWTGKAEAGRQLAHRHDGDSSVLHGPAGSGTSPDGQGGWKMMGRFCRTASFPTF